MIVRINGVQLTSDIHTYIQRNSYQSLSEVIQGNLTELIQDTIWYRENSDFNVFTNYKGVRNLCDDNPVCWMDAINRSVMESNEISGSLYKFIQHRVGLVREGFTENLLGDNLDAVLDCILWFF